MSAALLERAVGKAERLGRPRRAPAAALAHSPYRSGSWRAQRMLHRSRSRFRLLVSGRGVGKTHGCAYELLQIVLAAPAGSMGAVLAPTLTHAEAAIEKLREIAATLPGVTKESWVQSKRRLNLPGGRWIKVFSADRKETVRGPSIVALWIDEGAYIKEAAYTSSLPAIRRQGHDVQLLISTTPAGKNWVHARWKKAGADGSRWDRFRFRGDESPYNDPEVVAESRDSMSPEKFAQEYGAEFVDNLLLAFPDRDGLFADSLTPREKTPRRWLGVDLGLENYTVCTLMDEWGEGEVIGRWNQETPGFTTDRYTDQTTEKVLAYLREHGAALVVDTGGAGVGLGHVIASAARREGLEVVEVKTSSQGVKAKVVEQARLDVQHGRLKIRRNEHSDALDYELSTFQAIKRVHHGRELMVYEGPQVKAEYDDCVISLCLANWGRSQDETPPPTDLSGLSSFVSAAQSDQNRNRGGGYRFRMPGSRQWTP